MSPIVVHTLRCGTLIWDRGRYYAIIHDTWQDEVVQRPGIIGKYRYFVYIWQSRGTWYIQDRLVAIN